MRDLTEWLSAIGVVRALISVALLVAAILSLPRALKRFIRVRCEHDEYWENSSYKAVCSRCGRTLGPIEKVRSRRKV